MLVSAIIYACLIAQPAQCEDHRMMLEPAACHARSYRGESEGRPVRIGIKCEGKPK